MFFKFLILNNFILFFRAFGRLKLALKLADIELLKARNLVTKVKKKQQKNLFYLYTPTTLTVRVALHALLAHDTPRRTSSGHAHTPHLAPLSLTSRARTASTVEQSTEQCQCGQTSSCGSVVCAG